MPLLVIPQILAYHSIHLQFTHINSNGFGVYRVQIWYCEGIEEHVWANIGLQLLTLLAEKLPFEITYKTLFSVIVYTHTHTHTVPLVNVCGLRDQNLLFILLFWLPLIFIPEGLKSTQITHWLVSRLVEETFEINFSCLLLLWMRESWLWLFSWFSVDWVSRVLPIISLNFNWGDTPFVNFT